MSRRTKERRIRLHRKLHADTQPIEELEFERRGPRHAGMAGREYLPKLLRALSARVADRECCFTHERALAEEIGCERSTVARALREAVRQRLVKASKVQERDTGRRRLLRIEVLGSPPLPR